MSHYKQLVQFTNKKNLKDVLDELVQRQKTDTIITEELQTHIKNLYVQERKHVQKTGILRFNPFADSGGEQSFILAILDGNDSGVVVTSLHNRGTTRWYAKTVRQAKGVDYQLSQEEEKAIRTAISQK